MPKMRKLEIFLNVNAIVFVTIGLISFFVIHNVADAIFYMVVALLIRQEMDQIL